MKPQEFKFRKLLNSKGLVRSAVIEKESDLLILADKALTGLANRILTKERLQLEEYFTKNPKFKDSLKPVHVHFMAPKVIRLMSWAAKHANVSPMSAYTGALSEHIGKQLLSQTKELIIENSGDMYVKLKKPRKIGIYAGRSPFSEKIAIEIDPKDTPLGICTIAATSGHATSGSADAVIVTSKSCALADAAATAISNVVKSEETIGDGLDLAKKIKGLSGVLIIKNDKMGAWGTLKIVAL
jgi:uncharacterized protein